MRCSVVVCVSQRKSRVALRSTQSDINYQHLLPWSGIADTFYAAGGNTYPETAQGQHTDRRGSGTG